MSLKLKIVNEKIIILGAGTFQKGLILYLKEQGFYTIVVTNKPEELSARVADQVFDFSYTNTEKVIQLYREIKAVQIFSVASEGPLLTQSMVQEYFKLTGNSKEWVEFFLDKWSYKSQLNATNLAPFSCYLGNKDIGSFIKNGDHYMLKPVFGSGSAQVRKIDSTEQLETLTDHQSYILEKYIEGKEMGSDLFLFNNEVVYLCPTHKKTNEWNVPYAHLILSDSKHEILLPFINELKNALKLKDGFYNLDIMLKDDRPYLLDISPRLGGNGIPEILKAGYEINEYEYLLSWHMNKPTKSTDYTFKRNTGVYIIGARERGTLKTVVDKDHPFKQQAIELFWNKKIGERVQPFSEGKYHLGYFIYTAETDEELIEVQNQIETYQWFTLQKIDE